MNKDLELLIVFFWKAKKLSASKDDLPNIDLLEKKGIITFSGSEYIPSNYTLLAAEFLAHYKTKSAFEYSSDFSQTTLFIKRLKEDFFSDGYVHNFLYLGLEIWKIAIIETNKQFHLNFDQYINTLNKEDDSEDIFEFIEAYNDVINELNIPTEALYKNAIQLTEFAKGDATYNMPLGSILLGLKNKSENDENVGIGLLELALKSEPQDADIISAIVAGLYNKLGFSFYQDRLASLIILNEHKLAVINGLSNIEKIEDAEIKLFIKLFDQEKKEETSLPTITKLLFSVLKSKTDIPIESTYMLDIFSRINEAILLDNGQLAHFILHEIAFLHKYDTERVAIVKTIIDQPFFSIEKYGKSVEQIFWYLKDVNLLKKTFLAITEKCPFEKISDSWSITPNGFDKEKYDEILIEFISNHKASIRFVGLDLFNHCSLNGGYKFNKNILDLPPITQYKLWVGLTQDYKEPKYLVPALMPLLDSKSETVTEAFVSKLEEYTENYGQQIIEILKQHIDKSNVKHITIIKRIESYMQDYYAKNILVKKEIHELNPYYTHNKIFTNFNRLFHKTLRAKMHKSVEKNSFLSMLAKNVQLAKGGGWKIEGKNEISKLGHFESGFSLPREYFIFPNQYEMEESAKMRGDWTEEEFKLIRESIENEQQ